MDAALAALAHRGPDGEGRWRIGTRGGGEVALGHRRLAVIDPEGGAEPLFSHDRRLVISFNGEIYNHPELREALRLRGRRFVTRSDAEVLVEAYRVWGLDCLTRLRGMFAFALYDVAAERLVLARDPFGKKPLFLMETDGGMCFASEIAALLTLPGAGRRLNPSVLQDYLLSRCAPGPETFFQAVRKLPPGYFAVHEGGAFREERYFTPPLARVRPKNVNRSYAFEAFRAALGKAVALRLRADVPYGVYLSGGLDSSTIAALAVREAGTVRTFAVGFEDARWSELPHAARVAARLGAQHEAMTTTAEAFAEHWPTAVLHRGAPVSEASDIPLLMLSKLARSSVKVALTGEGADEILAGYPKHRAERWSGLYQVLAPPPLHRALVDPLVRRLPYPTRRLKILSRALGERDPQARARLWFANDHPDVIRRLRSDGGGRFAAAASLSEAPISTLRQMMLEDQTSWLPDNLLERGDRMLMAAGIEGRAPFMDVELAALVAGFPDEVLFDRRGGKAILRAVARDWLDEETLNRRKAGFRTPVGDWFRGALRPMVRDLLCGDASAVRRLVDGAVVDRMLGEHLERRVDHTDMLWTLANLELFLREYRLKIDA